MSIGWTSQRHLTHGTGCRIRKKMCRMRTSRLSRRIRRPASGRTIRIGRSPRFSSAVEKPTVEMTLNLNCKVMQRNQWLNRRPGKCIDEQRMEKSRNESVRAPEFPRMVMLNHHSRWNLGLLIIDSHHIGRLATLKRHQTRKLGIRTLGQNDTILCNQASRLPTWLRISKLKKWNSANVMTRSVRTRNQKCDNPPRTQRARAKNQLWK